MAKNTLHRVHRIDLASVPIPGFTKGKIEEAPCGCSLNKDHTESYKDYVKRANRENKEGRHV